MWLKDTLANLVSGLGTAKDKSTANVHLRSYRMVEEFRAAYSENWIARKIVDIIAFDMLREWRVWQADEAQVELIEATEKRLSLQGKILEGMKLARRDGEALLLVGDGALDPTRELLIERMARGGIRYVHVFNMDDYSTGPIVLDPESPYFRRPSYYEIATKNGTRQRFHPSRGIPLIGTPSLDLMPGRAGHNQGDSVLRSVFEAIDQATSSAAYVNAMLPEAKQDVISVPNLSEYLATRDGTERLTERFAYAARMKSMFGMLLLEGDGKSPEGEIFEQKQINFSGLPDVVRLYLQIASGAADIPATRLLGQAPAGLNATGDADTRNYYDGVAARQKVELTPALMPLDEMLIRDALGSRPPGVWYNWNPLYQPSEKEKAEVGKIKADTVAAMVNTGTIPDEVMGEGVKGWLIGTDLFPGIEQAYDSHQGPLVEELPDVTEGDNVIPFRRQVANDAAPRTLYVSRKLKNGADLIDWAKSQGFGETLKASDLHVTIAYSKAPVDWMKVGETWQGEELKVASGGPRIMERFGDAVVLLFSSGDLEWRHREIAEAGATWDHPDYQPHVTISYNAADIDLSAIQAYNGPLVFGPELFAEVDEDWKEKVLK